MSIIGINGSPRIKGNTARFVRETLAGAAEAGAETTFLHLEELNIAPCVGCLGCKETARCVVSDGMGTFYEAIERNTAPLGLVIGTPIYFDHVSAQTKIWIDRLYAYTYTQLGQKMFPKGYRAVLIATYDWDNPTAYDGVLDWFQERLEFYHEIEVIEKLRLCNATNSPLEQHPDLIARARAAGRRLAEAG